jgi:plasmid stabilization system protein ParE
VHYDLIIRPEAEAEMADAYAWYDQRVKGLGNQFLLSIDAVLQAVVRNPYQYPQVFKTIRRALIHRFPYAVFYIVSDIRITVLAVFHLKRDPKRWKKRN